MKIKINGYENNDLKFNYKTFRILAEMWGYKYIMRVFARFGQIGDDSFETFIDLILAAIRADGNDVITADEVGGWLFEDFGRIEEISKALEKVMPTGKEGDEGKLKAAAPQKANP